MSLLCSEIRVKKPSQFLLFQHHPYKKLLTELDFFKRLELLWGIPTIPQNLRKKTRNTQADFPICFSYTNIQSLICHSACLVQLVASSVVLNHSSASTFVNYCNPWQSDWKLCLFHLGQRGRLLHKLNSLLPFLPRGGKDPPGAGKRGEAI